MKKINFLFNKIDNIQKYMNLFYILIIIKNNNSFFKIFFQFHYNLKTFFISKKI